MPVTADFGVTREVGLSIIMFVFKYLDRNIMSTLHDLCTHEYNTIQSQYLTAIIRFSSDQSCLNAKAICVEIRLPQQHI